MTVENNRIFKLLEYGISDGTVFLPSNDIAVQLAKDCLELYNRDNVCTTLDNSKGFLCSTYPVNLIVPLEQKSTARAENSVDAENIRANEWIDLITKGRFARTWGRFPIPVLLIGEKFICRSSTLARSPEIYTRMGYQYFMQGEPPVPSDNGNQQNGASNGQSTETSIHFKNDDKQSLETVEINGGLTKRQSRMMQSSIQSVNGTNQNKEWLVDKMRKTDIDLLHSLRVSVICDLMVENKKVKFGINLTSSEKVDRQKRYSDFELVSIPYPGCEFFADYSQNNYTGVGLRFDWKQAFVDAELQVPRNLTNLSSVKWKEYMGWDLVKLTQNYLKLILNCIIRPSSSGMLLHCISGWDRTPLFISLLRLSFWADGLIHQSLDAEEVVFLTLAYDWLLFSHQFSDRIYKSQEIMHFCFEFLKDITSSEYSLLSLVRGMDNPFSCSEPDGLFDIENLNLSNGNDHHSESNTLEKSLNGVSENSEEFEELHQEHNCKNSINGIQDNFLDSSDNILPDFQAVKTCLDCVLNNVGEPTVFPNNNHCCENDDMESSKITLCNSTHQQRCESPPAVLPLTCSTPEKNDSSSPFQSECIDHSGGNCAELIAPRSALSSSLETAKKNIYLDQVQSASIADSQNVMSNSYDYSEDSKFPRNKSEPISVPTNCQRVAECAVASYSISSSISTTAATAEPGSSWQMISAPSPRDTNSSENNSYTPCETFSFCNNSVTSHSSSSIGAMDSETLKVRLQKRKEKLHMAHTAMIPAYCAVVQRQRQRQQQESTGLSALMGSLVHFVKRS